MLTAFPSSQSLIIAISEYRDAEGKTGPFVRRFLIDQLHYNDNMQNQVCLGRDSSSDILM